jgi:hypothetical protein
MGQSGGAESLRQFSVALPGLKGSRPLVRCRRFLR